jgi:hypothetical protein
LFHVTNFGVNNYHWEACSVEQQVGNILDLQQRVHLAWSNGLQAGKEFQIRSRATNTFGAMYVYATAVDDVRRYI